MGINNKSKMGILTKYMCWSLDLGVTMLGFGQLNAALFFWARFATLEPIYMWIDLWTAIMFTLRVIWYFGMVGDDYSPKTRKDYYECNKLTCFGLVLTAATTIICKWLEWGHVPISNRKLGTVGRLPGLPLVHCQIFCRA